ncbi:D-alanyl-D-alanine carboxypeptidase family protein [Promicromonospora thailandica]|uniref:D-alanyl-D-alanine carboxypeptidase family protein n=1 Tax=Promicromonospora thailandica TaxID=765201 RepID=UPI0020A39B5A|nr:D-alanyl-D-alanine carboxypeptidase family protein [Promicromonospora thailandica]
MTREHQLVPRRTRRPGAHRAHTTVAAHPAHPAVRRSSLVLAAALTSVALTTTAAVSLTGSDNGTPGAATAVEPTALPSAAAADPEVRSAAEKADAVLSDAAYVTREGDLSAKERKRLQKAAQELRTMVEQARQPGGTPSPAREAVASRSAGRTPLAERAAQAPATEKDDAADPAPSADPTAPTNLPAATGAAPIAETTSGLTILETPLSTSIEASAGSPAEDDGTPAAAPSDAEKPAASDAEPSADAAAPADTGAPSAAQITKETRSLERLVATTGGGVVSVRAGPTPEEIAAAKKAAAERKAAKAARAAERAAAQAAAEAKKMAEAAKSYGNGQIPSDVLCGLSWTNSEQLRCDAAAALEDLNGAFRAAFGRNLDLTDGYRSYGEQVSVAATRGGLAAVPGTSNHGLGQAVDLSGGIESFGSAEHAWMVANAGKYGWKHPAWAQAGGSKPEAWHWEYGTTY